MESLKDFYRNLFNAVPADLEEGRGHFAVLDLNSCVGSNTVCLTKGVRDFYKIVWVQGSLEVICEDRGYVVDGFALFFCNPHVSCALKSMGGVRAGMFCIFDRPFIESVSGPLEHQLFQPRGEHLYMLNKMQAQMVKRIVKGMSRALQTDELQKMDVVRGLFLELVHFVDKSKLSEVELLSDQNASQRIATMFMELLECQFPIDNDHGHVFLRTPSDFAAQLNIHVNHLNRSLKRTTGKTTTTLILDRLLQESKDLLQFGDRSILDLSHALGFKEPTHFTNFFKKHTGESPTQYRKSSRNV